MPNPWIEHVRKYAKDNNISYGCAVTEAKASYVKQPKAPRKTRTPKQNKSIQERLQQKMEKIRMKGSTPFTEGQQKIKDKILLRILKNRGDRGL